MIEISLADLDAPEFAELVMTHTLFCDGTAPPDSCHRLPLSDLKNEEVKVWQAKNDGILLGMGALKALSSDKGEVKSMHTFNNARGMGVGSKLLATILAEARTRNYKSLWLETGIHPDFAAARKLYEVNGFEICGPFGTYKTDPHSQFMMLDLYSEKAGH